jgi:hypothetical protein
VTRHEQADRAGPADSSVVVGLGPAGIRSRMHALP